MSPVGAAPDPMVTDAWAEQYLDLLARCLTRAAYPEEWCPYVPARTLKGRAGALVQRRLRHGGYDLIRARAVDPDERREGRDWPASAETMIGLVRLENVRDCVRTVIRDGVPGDLIECGVWRGGAAIFMRAALRAYGDPTRQVWLADSFAGLPPPDRDRFPLDRDSEFHRFGMLAVPLAEVRANFERYGLLDDRVRFLPGWFRDTLPTAPPDRLAVLRADGDMYGSTTEILESLYERVPPGGFVIIDDWGAVAQCRAAVEDFRRRARVTEPLQRIDGSGVYWRRDRA